MIELTRSQIAELRGCTPATVSRAHLPKTDGGNYDLLDREVWQYVIAPDAQKAIEEHQRRLRQADEDDGSIDGLEAEKLRAEIEWKKKQSRKLDLQHEIEKKDLVPSHVIALWIGYFATGIRNNFLTLAKRVSRGDDELQKRIDRQVTKAIEKTIASAKRELRKEVESIAESMEDE